MQVLCISGHLNVTANIILTNRFFSDLGPNFLCWRGNPYGSWESQFSITPYMESNCCVLEIIFGGFIQISR